MVIHVDKSVAPKRKLGDRYKFNSPSGSQVLQSYTGHNPPIKSHSPGLPAHLYLAYLPLTPTPY